MPTNRKHTALRGRVRQKIYHKVSEVDAGTYWDPISIPLFMEPKNYRVSWNMTSRVRKQLKDGTLPRHRLHMWLEDRMEERL